jgi:5-formyltetrahydrofolate cyclo-ligase
MTDPTDAASQKATLRRETLARRDGLDTAWRATASERMAGLAMPHIDAIGPAIVAGYWPIRSEADPRPLLTILRTTGATLALPAPSGEGLAFRAWRDGAPLVPAGFGTVAPGEQSPDVVPDLILLPLAAFDSVGHRLGYGKGHYDRTLAGLAAAGQRPLLIGVAFCVQEVDRIPFEPHDVALDLILTEDGVRDLRQER